MGLGIKIGISNYIYILGDAVVGGESGVKVWIIKVGNGLKFYVGLVYLVDVFGVKIFEIVFCEGDVVLIDVDVDIVDLVVLGIVDVVCDCSGVIGYIIVL